MSEVISLNDGNFESHITSGIVLVDFSASWCGPCKVLGPIVDKISTELSGKVKVCKVDIDDAPLTSTKYNIRSVPTLMVFKDGVKTDQAVGALSREKILSLINL
jgi:thioredoxin 1